MEPSLWCWPLPPLKPRLAPLSQLLPFEPTLHCGIEGRSEGTRWEPPIEHLLAQGEGPRRVLSVYLNAD